MNRPSDSARNLAAVRDAPSHPPARGAESPHQIETLPPCPAHRTEQIRIGFVLGLVSTWFLPRRTGPHLAAGSWRAAVAAHLIGLAATVLLFPLLAVRAGALTDPITLFHAARDPHLWVEDLFRAFSTLFFSEAVLLGMALSLMAWAAAGESPKVLFSRCCKWVFWFTSLALPVLVTLHAAASASEWLWDKPFDRVMERGPFGAPVFVLVNYLCCWWLVWVFLRGLLDYAGPESGPGWDPIEPVCEKCGYQLRHQPAEGVCPECATPIRESLPGGMRKRSAPCADGAALRPGYRRTLWGLWFGAPLAANAPRTELSEARRFCVDTLLIAWFPLHFAVPGTVYLFTLSADDLPPLEELSAIALMIGAVFCAMMLVAVGTGWIACLVWGWWRNRQRDLRISATTALYCTGLALPPLIHGTCAVALFIFLAGGLDGTQWKGILRERVTFDMRLENYYWAAHGAIGLFWASWCGLRVMHHARTVRYTNS